MMRLLDTNVLSEIVRATPNAAVAAQLSKRRSTEIFASAVSRYELRYGAALRQDADRLWSRLQREVLPVATWLPVTQDIAERGGAISAELHRRGKPCGDLDPLLAATALVHDLILVTRNVRHFEHVPGLALENWFGES
jgi:predicted nucleic acid-binding protein